jgi:hypothetical protein
MLSAERFPDSRLGNWSRINGEMDEPRPVVVPEMMIRIGRIKPNERLKAMIHDGLLIEQTASREI